MKVFNLSCANEHRFEGWFQSAADYDDQHARGLLICPNCGDANVRKLLSAPRLNLSGASAASKDVQDVRRDPSLRAEQTPTPAVKIEKPIEVLPAMRAEQGAHPNIEQMQALWYRVAQEVIRNTEDVGSSFAEEARKIHYREAPERGIRGQATPDEAAQLADEGIELFAMALPESMKNPLQ